MLFNHIPFPTLSVIALLTQTSIQSSAPHRRSRAYHSGNHNPIIHQRRDVTQPEVTQLQTEYIQLKGWMDAFFATANAQDQGVATLKNQFAAYDGWISNFFTQAGIAGAAAAPSAPVANISSASAPLSTSAMPMSAPPSSSATPASASTSSPGAKTSAASPASMTPAMSSAAGYAPYPANASVPAPTGSNSANSSGPFNAKSSSNQVVYYGQTPATQQVKLATLCQDPNVDMVVLAFLKTYFGPGGYPVLNLGAACGSDATKEAQAKGATGILDCPEVASGIKTCQNNGKKVLLSLGGADGTTVFASEVQAIAFATTIWNLFGGGTSDVGRPFGNVTIDGFDIDTEQKNPAHYDTFTAAIRATFSQDKSKPYYISAAPQCPRPDASIPLAAMQQMDFVWVQFYNNGPCNVNGTDFLASLTAWSADLSAAANGGGANGSINGSTSGASGGPQLYIGAPACQTCGPNGFLQPTAVAPAVQSVRKAKLGNFGGVMLWDGSEGMLNVQGNKSYLQVVKAALA